jgi:hypothetical protein
MKKWTLENFKQYIREKVDEYYYVTPSMVVLKSFYVIEVEKSKEVTVRMFDWLLSIAEQEIKTYKSKLNTHGTKTN